MMIRFASEVIHHLSLSHVRASAPSLCGSVFFSCCVHWIWHAVDESSATKHARYSLQLLEHISVEWHAKKLLEVLHCLLCALTVHAIWLHDLSSIQLVQGQLKNSYVLIRSLWCLRVCVGRAVCLLKHLMLELIEVRVAQDGGCLRAELLFVRLVHGKVVFPQERFYSRLGSRPVMAIQGYNVFPVHEPQPMLKKRYLDIDLLVEASKHR
mmetsp:Transcript_21289/g.53032  ORF Transcript_21289/g.53032 Transcript_21289/m.53032 type:complete len:210 (+) Transcript_21289:350-979(+)